MKKSQLRNIIRESIKELMTEQSTGVYHRWQGQMNSNGNCSPSGIQNFHTTPGCMTSPTCNTPQGNHDAWVAMGSPNPGEFVKGDGPSSGYITGCWKYLGTSPNPQTSQYGAQPYYSNFTYTTLTNCSSCWDPTPTPCTTYGCTDPTATNYNSTILPNCDQGCVWLGCTDSTASNYDPVATIDDGSCILGNAGCPTCDSSAWGNHQNWITQFTSMPHFSSSNPNQPCNMICNKIQIWDNNCQNAGPVQANQLACKIEEAQNQSQIHGCNC